MTAVLDALALADAMPPRPFVRDTRTRKFREKDFRVDAKNKVGPARWKKMTSAQRNKAIRSQRQSWAKKNIGKAPPLETYDTWLRKQPTAFQNEVLGIRKGAAFRKGLKLDKFIDRKGNELTLVQLKEKFPSYVTVQ